MGELFTTVLMDLLLIGIIFSIFVAIRNKWFRTKEYGTFEKRDIFVLLLIAYILFVFGPEDADFFNKEILITRNYKPSEFIWIPFRFLALKQDFLKFQIYIGGSSTYYSLLTFSDYCIYYCRLILISLPIAFLLNMTIKKKWIGFIFNIGILILCFGLTNSYYIGDGLVMGAIAYMLVAMINTIYSKLIKKDISWLKYLSFGILVTLVLIFVMDFYFYFPSNEKLVEIVPFEKQFKTYDDLITVNLENISLYKGGRNGEYLGFHGYLDFDEKLFENTPFNLKNTILNERISVKHEYSYKGNKHGLGTSINEFSSHPKDSFFDHELKFYDYQSNYKQENNKQLSKDNDEPNYFEYYGISFVSFGLENYTEFSGFEIMEEGFKKDKYLYYEVIYKINKFEDFNIQWFINAESLDANSNDINHEYTEPEIIEETDEYIIKKEKYYYYKVHREDINRVDINVY
ncbi:hypothetical protein SH1V18_19230 [Vallitalea longa]|uniref:Uncharacterized protein n=1 Tax=Vallitalea longa TaxID=2936439 RepID=A0A9W5YDX6_9FIRM|nr:hypothetical protein [Vallitalea longa]GKX29443.1 hypothetical protein SH1V18_19230 [Vallitalea longa]